MGTAIVCLVILVLCIIGIKSTAKRASRGCCGGSGENVKKVKAKDTKKEHYPWCCVIEVEGMTCSNCSTRVENAFHEAGEFLAKADLVQVEVCMKEKLTDQQLRQIIRQAGYQPGRCTWKD